MSPETRKLHIYYRHVHAKAEASSRDPNKRRPAWFSYEACFRNLLSTIIADPLGSRVELTLVFDGTEADFLDDFSSRYFANKDYGIKLQFIKGGSDRNSSLISLHMANTADMPDDDLIYILENDYLHQPGWVSKVFELYSSGIVFDYVSLYDHRDKYFLDIYKELTAKIFVSHSHHWRTAPSTCASFVMSKKVLREEYETHIAGIPDYFLFGKLTNEQKRILLTPIPGLATHCMEGYLSPVIDWTKVIV
jgi:hypothetical protein